MKKNISLIDFGAGNLHSVHKALKFVGANIEITNDESRIEKSDAVIFPGVGAFGSVMQSIRENNLESIIKKMATSGKPFLGICVGMQVLFESGEENPDMPGLGVFKGNVVKFKKAKKIPHIGWNDVGVIHESPLQKFYFVHSYYVIPEDKNLIYAKSNYDGEEFCCAVKKDNLLAVQFHPEKSGDAGLNFLSDFVKKI
jgi:imidazole glycerol phosphate synthase glutamine amidotransferase subunit